MEIVSSHHAYDFLKRKFRTEVEEFWAVSLTAEKRVISSQMLFRGTVDFCHVHLRDILRFACTANSSSLLVAHNHPTGSVFPSHEDIELTRRIASAGRLIQIPLVDHLIISRDKYLSFADEGYLEKFKRCKR